METLSAFEFIPLSFWYDAPLTSRYSDRRPDPMAGLRFTDLRSRPMEFLDFTSVTVDEFQQLVPPFEAAFQARMAAWQMDGKPRTARRFTV
jgi:hypothetical protein